MSDALPGHSASSAFEAWEPSRGNGAYCIKIRNTSQYTLIMKSIMKLCLDAETMKKDRNVLFLLIGRGCFDAWESDFDFQIGRFKY